MPTSQRPDPSTLRQVQLSSGTSTTRSGSSFTARQTSSYTATTAPDSPQQPRPQLAPGANDSPNECAPPTNRTATTASNLPLLSPPTTAATLSGRAPSPTLPGPVKATRFDRSALHDHWTRFKRTTGFGPPGPLTGTGTGTGTGSSSLEESGADEEGRNYTHKGSGGVRWGRVVARTITSDGGGSREGPINRGGRVWGRKKWRDEDMEMGRSVAGSVDHAQYKTRRGTNASLDGMGDDECDDDEVDAVVVDNQFLSLDKSTQRSQSTHPHHPEETGTPPTGPTGSTSSGVAESRAMVMLRYRIWPVIERFFSLHFHDPISEAQYRKETFYTNKTLTFWAACFLILNWVLAAALLSKPYSLHDEIVIFGIIPFLTVPLPIFITFDWPRTRPWFYQVWLACTVWCWGFYNVFLMYLCGVYGQPKVISCGNRDFLVLFYYVTGLPVIAIFAMGQNRTLQTFMVVTFIAISGGMLLPWRRSWIRNTLNLIIYHAFVLYINWMRETAERRLYVLRDQLKTQYKQTQKAQISERKSSDSKRRLTSYIFHEVRVPLNTALLAAQNLAGTNAIQREHEIEFNALEGSLNMMSKVLNDVLDFNRMDSGRFETVSKPFAFHAVIRSMLVPLGLGASAKGLQLIVELDEEIDVQARLAAYRAQAREVDFGQDDKRRTPDTFDRTDARKRAEEWVAQRMEEGSEEDGIVMGDEMRLRQVVTNLASNACKFTESGGHITLRTKLIIPGPETRTRVSIDRPPRRQSESTDDSGKQLEDSNGHSNDHTHVHIAPPLWRGTSGDSNDENRALEHIVVRIEVEDTGVGIGQRDMEEKRLFSAFMQTSSGLRQGGKGTGLGLALVRHIVALSGGRLGVKSKRAVGSTFWVELPLGVGRKAVAGVHATRARDAAVDAINFSGAWNNVDEAVNRSIPEPVASPPALSSPEGEETPTPMHSGVAPGEIMTSSGDASTGLSSGALLAAGAPLTPLQGGSALRSIMEHGGVVELVPTLPMQASAEEAPIVATRTLSPENTRQSPGISPSTSRAGPSDMSSRMDPTASRAVLSDPTASRIVVTDPRAVTGASAAAQTPTDTRASPKPSAHRSMPSESSLPQLKLSPGVAPGPNAPGNASPVKAVGSAESLAPLRVLVVDDDSLTRRLMTRMLTRLGCTVENAENGQIALDMLLAPLPTPQSQRTQSSAGFPPSAEPTHMASASWDYAECKYDIVFLDNHMPVCSGVEVAKRLRQLDRKDFVVGVTGNALTEDQQEYLQAGANHVLTKPVLEKSLKAMLVLADERRKARGT